MSDSFLHPEFRAECIELTPAELAVLIELATGKTNRQIAEGRVTSVLTVQNQVHSLLAKTGQPNRTALTVFAIAAGLVDPKDAVVTIYNYA